MRICKKVWKTAMIFIAGAIGGVMLLTLAFLIPVNENNKAATNAILEKEGWYPAIPTVSASLDTYFHSYLPGVLDDSSDGIILQMALDPEEENVLRAAMDMRGYSRYWHGYVSILRPLLLAFDYGEIRVMNAMCQIIFLVLLFLFIYQKMGIKYSLLALTSYYLLMPMAMPFSLHYSWVFYITYGVLLYLTSREKGKLPNGIKLYWIFMIVGMLTSYFDLMTNPLYTYGVPMIWWLLLQKEDQRQNYYVKKVIFAGIWWLSGYAGMWFMKWCLGSIVLGRNIFENAFAASTSWMDSEGGLALSERLAAIYANWKHYEYKIYVILLLGWLLFIFISSMKSGIVKNIKNKALMLVALSPAVWYFVVAKQTTVHHFFTHRAWGISILAILSLLLLSTKTSVVQKNKKRMRILLAWGICGIVAVGLSFLPKEDIFVTNGYCEFNEVPMGEGAVCEMSFTPSFPKISRFGLCAKTDSRNGKCKIIISDEETNLYEEYILLDEYQDSSYAEIPVTWDLEKEKTYSMQISFENVDDVVHLLVTAEHNMPLSEYDEVHINDEVQSGQILSMLNYRYRALSKLTLCALWIGWMGILLGIWMAFLAKNGEYVSMEKSKQ